MAALNHVVLLDKIDLSAKTILSENGIKVDVYEKFSEIPASDLNNVDGLIVRSATKVTPEVMAQCPNLKIIGRAGTGVDNINVPHATSRGIVVMNTPGGNTISAAEHTCFMIIALARNAANNNTVMKSHKWSKGAGQELMGKTLGIVGLGRIGTEVATRMQSFGMHTIGFDPIVGASDVAKYNIQWLPLEQMWPLCDYITVHTPLIPQTKDLISTKTLNLCKRGVKIVNVARGGIVNEADLLVALNSGQCGGAGLDVFVDEPLKDWTLVDHPNLVATAHLGASTKEGQLKCGQEIASQFVDFSNKSSNLVGVINSQALVAAMAPESASWLKLGIELGQLLAAMKGASNLKGDWKIDISGALYPASLKRFIVPAVAAGIMQTVDNTANLINSQALAEKLGVLLSFSAQEVQGDVPSELKLSTDNQSITGAVSNTFPCLKSVNEFVFDPVLLDDITQGCMFLGILKQSQVGDLVSKLQTSGLKRINLAVSNDSVCVIGVATQQASNLNGMDVAFTTTV